MANWLFPVIGATEWSTGSWMPYTQTHRGRTHAAVDIYATSGQTIISPVAGVVKNFGSGNIGGNWIQIEGNDGNVYYFAHMDQAVTLEKGQNVGPGTAIGIVGNSGSAKTTSPHVHFSVKSGGKAVSPVEMLQQGVIVPNVQDLGDQGMGFDPDASDYGGYTGTEPGDYDSAPPAWIQQLEDYRAELGLQEQTEAPIKERARDRLRQTLMSMSNMVRQQGFDTGAGMPDTGIVEDENETGVTRVSREEGRRA